MATMVDLGDGKACVLDTDAPDQEAEFISVLKEVWQRLPIQDRMTILAHYGEFPVLLFMPLGKSPGSPGLSNNDQLLWCDPRVFADMSRAWAVAVVAHELAHGNSFAIRHPTHTAPEPKPSDAKLAWSKAIEDQAESVYTAWGFDMTDYRACLKWLFDQHNTTTI